MIICAISREQRFAKDGYWHKKLKKNKFTLVRKSGNRSGKTMYFYMRIPLKEAIMVGGE